MFGDAFTAGTVPGGLNSTTDINILICVLLYRTGSLYRDDILEAISGTGSANYFEAADALNESEQKGNAVCDSNGFYSLTASGINICESLESDLPLTVREKVISEAERLADFRRKSKTNKVDIVPDGKGGYCFTGKVLNAEGNADLEIKLILPTRETAEKASDKFISDAEYLERTVIEILMNEKID